MVIFLQSESIGFLVGTVSSMTSTPTERASALLALGSLAEVTGRAFAQADKVLPFTYLDFLGSRAIVPFVWLGV